MPARLQFASALLLLPLAVWGCGPRAVDLRPFAEQTRALTDSVSESGQSTVELMWLAEGLDYELSVERGGVVDGTPSAAAMLALEWQKTLGMLAALEAYAESLAALREAADDASVAVKDAVNSLNAALDVVGLSGLSGPLARAAARAYAAIAERSAGRSQLQSMELVQEHVAQLGGAVSTQLRELGRLAQSAADFAEVNLNARATPWRTYYTHLGDELDLLTQLLERHQEIELLRERASRLRVLAPTPALASRYALRDPVVQRRAADKLRSGACATERQCVDEALLLAAAAQIEGSALRAEEELAMLAFGSRAPQEERPVALALAHERWMKRVHFVREERAHYAPQARDLAREIAQLRATSNACRGLASSTSAAVGAWVSAHADVQRALVEGSGVSLTDLAVAIREIRAVYRDVQRSGR